MIARDQTFSKMRITIDGCSFYNCTFDGCVLVYCASLPVVLENCQYTSGCRWEMDRAAKATLDFLTAMYRGGATSIIENTFDLIRGGRKKGEHLM
jgi:Zn-finger protein